MVIQPQITRRYLRLPRGSTHDPQRQDAQQGEARQEECVPRYDVVFFWRLRLDG